MPDVNMSVIAVRKGDDTQQCTVFSQVYRNLQKFTGIDAVYLSGITRCAISPQHVDTSTTWC